MSVLIEKYNGVAVNLLARCSYLLSVDIAYLMGCTNRITYYIIPNRETTMNLYFETCSKLDRNCFPKFPELHDNNSKTTDNVSYAQSYRAQRQ